MKSSKLGFSDVGENMKLLRRFRIMQKRQAVHIAHHRAGRSWIKSMTQVRVFKKGWRGIYSVREFGKYPHSSARQQARYSRQIAAGQLNFK